MRSLTLTFLLFISLGKCFSQGIFANLKDYITYSLQVGKSISITPIHYSMVTTTTTDSGLITNCTLYFTATKDTVIKYNATDFPPVPMVRQLNNIYIIPLWELDSTVCDDKTIKSGIFVSN